MEACTAQEHSWFRVHMVLGNLDSYEQGQSAKSEPQGPAGYFQMCLTVFPRGTDTLALIGKTALSAFVQVLPPPEQADSDWSCKGVRFAIYVKYQRGHDEWCLCKSDTWNFSKESDDRGWHDIVAWDKLHGERGWLNALKQVELEAYARLPLPDPPNPLVKALDLSQEPVIVKFLLRDSPPVFFDKRVLMARSEYFREMFSSLSWREALTNEVDLHSDSEVDGSSLSSLCLFLMTDTFHAQGDVQLALSVRKLADRYRLDSLVKKAETELERLLCTDNALSLLAHVTGSGGKLEQACLDCITADNCDLLEKQHDKLDTIAEENPELMKQLVRLLLQARGKRPRTE